MAEGSGAYDDAALVLLGHGTDLNEGSAAPVLQQVAELRRQGRFAEVHAAFWKQDPLILDVLSRVARPRCFVVPFFISEGYFSQEVIPAALGFSLKPGDGRSRVIRSAGRELRYCKPVGTHESVTAVLLARAREIVQRFPFPRSPLTRETTLFIAGHGTGRNGNSRASIERQADLLRQMNLFADVRAVYMEEEPLIGSCYDLAQTRNIVVVPFFLSDGLHVTEDIPVLLGEPQKVVEERLARGKPPWRNPTEKRGKLVWYTSSIGTEPLMAEVILERAREARAW